jgi:hypothetical protein
MIGRFCRELWTLARFVHTVARLRARVIPDARTMRPKQGTIWARIFDQFLIYCPYMVIFVWMAGIVHSRSPMKTQITDSLSFHTDYPRDASLVITRSHGAPETIIYLNPEEVHTLMVAVLKAKAGIEI